MTIPDAVGVVGLGLMGSAMAERLIAAGYDVHGFTRSHAARLAHVHRGGVLAGSPAEVANRCRVVILSLPDGRATRSVCLGPHGIADGGEPGTVVVDTSTISPDDAVGVGTELAERGISFLDAGLSGSSTAVARSSVLAVIGGSTGDFPLVRAVLEVFCSSVVNVGGPGDGMRAKLVINLVHGLNRFALAEGLVLAEMMDMDLEQMLEVLRASAASSRAMDTWGPQMVRGQHYPPRSRVRTGAKDAELIAELGRRHGAPMLGLSQFLEVLRTAVAQGLGDADNSSIVEVLRRMAGIGRVPPTQPATGPPPSTH